MERLVEITARTWAAVWLAFTAVVSASMYAEAPYRPSPAPRGGLTHLVCLPAHLSRTSAQRWRSSSSTTPGRSLSLAASS
jgi:hypothetical protein